MRLTIEIPDAVATRVVDALAVAYGYRDKLDGGLRNPTTKEQFVVRALKDHIRGLVVAHETAQAEIAAREAANAKALAEVQLP